MSGLIQPLLLVSLLAAAPDLAPADEPDAAATTVGAASATSPAPPAGGAPRLLERIEDAELRGLVAEVLARNPDLAAAAARARAAERRAPQARALPEPMTGLTAYLLQPETRVGPQEVMATWSQRLPWLGKRSLREQVALSAAAVAAFQAEAKALALVTETRRLYHELSFLDVNAEVVQVDRSTLGRYEELARVRYESGEGLAQAVIKLQAEITRDDRRLLDLADRRAAVVAALNALRDRGQEVAIGPRTSLPEPREVVRDAAAWRARALRDRPELGAAAAEIAQAELATRLARKEYQPDVTLGLTYTLVGNREDPAGRLSPPPDNGQDVLGVTAAVNVPLWRKRRSAGVEETVEREGAARDSQRAAIAAIDQSLGELGARLELLWSQLRLFQDVLTVQAEESLRSAESAYAAGTLGVLELLDAERVLLDVRIATSRARADYAVTLARLEGAIAGPLAPGP